jgi:DNA-binding MarR family transcriptional regulator
MAHPTSRLDPAIHQPARLGILSAACETKRIDFVSLRDLLDLTDGNLSRHLVTLENAGYIKIDKTFEGRKPRTWISATRAGRKALEQEIAALREIVEAAGAPARSSRPAPLPGPQSA